MAERLSRLAESGSSAAWSASLLAILVIAILFTSRPDFETSRSKLQVKPALSPAGESVVRRRLDPTPRDQPDVAGAPAANASRATTKYLPDGSALQLPASSVEARILSFIQADGHRREVVWFALDRVGFKKGKTKLLPSSLEQLRNVAAIFAAHPKLRAIIHGRAQDGDVAKRKLSQKRVSIVRRELGQMGVDPSRLSSKEYKKDSSAALSAIEQGGARDTQILLGLIPNP
ncbi:OmpA family protein [Methylocystis echinoides]|uniref:OmpA family protein n=1 Tax=Methylocystis echinoides TaxID=29468 RepID=UPI002491F401|nr:OmpA family protein [Methylocystis echinoides]